MSLSGKVIGNRAASSSTNISPPSRGIVRRREDLGVGDGGGVVDMARGTRALLPCPM